MFLRFALIGLVSPAAAQDTYSNETLGVSVTKTPNWKFISEEERQSALESTKLKTSGLKEFVREHMSKPFLVITKPRDISPQPTITVLVAPLDYKMTSDPLENLKSMAASGARAFEDYEIAEEPRNVVIGGRKGAHVRATYTLTTKDGQHFPTSFETWHAVRGDHYFLIGVVSRQPEDQATAREIKQIISSLKIREISSTP